MDKAKIVIVIEETDKGYTVETNVNGIKLLYPLNQIAINIAADWGIDKAKYFSLLDELWEEQKATTPASSKSQTKISYKGNIHEKLRHVKK